MKTSRDEPALPVQGSCPERRGNSRGVADTNRPALAFMRWGWRRQVRQPWRPSDFLSPIPIVLCIIILALSHGASKAFAQDSSGIQESKKAKQDTSCIHIQWKEPPQVRSSEIKIDFTEKQQAEFEMDILFSEKGVQISASKETGVFVCKEIKVPLESPEPFLAASSVWTIEGSDDGRVTLSVRGSPDGGSWTEWLDISVDEHATPQPGEFFGNLVFFDRETRYIQHRFALETGLKRVSPAVTGLRIIFISPGATPKEVLDEIKELEPRYQKQFDEEPGFHRLGELEQTDSIKRDASLLQIPRPPFISRTGWGCQEGQLSPRWTPAPTTATHLIIHHTDNSNTSSDWPAVVRSIWVFHANTRGWGDIGYNWLVDPDGIIYQGRAWERDTDDNVRGAHFCGANSGTMGVAALGTFTTVSPTTSALTRIRDILAWKSSQRSINPHGISFHAASGLNLYNIAGHSDGCATICPGGNLYAQLPTIRNQVHDLLNPITIPVAPTATAATGVTTVGFVANWNSAGGATGYRIDVSVSSTFASYVSGYQDLDVGNVLTRSVSGLAGGTPYYYRVRAYNSGGASGNSGTVTVTTTTKVSGAAREVGTDIRHPNGNTYDQVLLTGTSAAITADPGQVTRISFVDLTDDIVQVEFSGPGFLTVTLTNASGPALAANYNQPAVHYMKGHAAISITGANESTHVSIFSVGRFTAVNQALFRNDVSYDGMADVASLSISSANGWFGGVRTANAGYNNTQGITGVSAPGVQFSGPVFVGDIAAFDDARPVLVLGGASDVRITGGDLSQPNGRAVQVDGFNRLQMTAGTDSHGRPQPAQPLRARLERNGVDVTSQLFPGGG